jgi:hypothetical protein
MKLKSYSILNFQFLNQTDGQLPELICLLSIILQKQM